MGNIGSLAGLRVLDLSRMLPGPYCSMMLGDHGADVIAIEDQRFKKDQLFFHTVNRNKRHLSLNLKSPEGKEIFFKLAGDADIILEGFRPGVVKRLGVDYKTVKAMNPGIIYCSITGYGQDGPGRDRPGHDVNYMSTAGLLELIGPEDSIPAIPGVQFADIAGGSMNAFSGILLALYARTISGKGQYIDISMTDGLVGYLSLPHYFSTCSDRPPVRSNDLLSHRYGCYNTYVTLDNKYLAIGAVENRFWLRLCELLGVPGFGPLQYDDKDRERITGELRTIFSGKTIDEWDSLLADEDVCYSRILSYQEVLESRLFRERGMVVESIGEQALEIKELGVPIKLSDSPGAIRTPAVTFGASTIQILQELGYHEEQIKDFSKRNIT